MSKSLKAIDSANYRLKIFKKKARFTFRTNSRLFRLK